MAIDARTRAPWVPSEVPAIINLVRLIGSTTRFGALGAI
jgi:hypothetical protein